MTSPDLESRFSETGKSGAKSIQRKRIGGQEMSGLGLLDPGLFLEFSEK